MTEITRERLTAALDGMEMVVEVLNPPVPGQWVGAKPRYPGSLAEAILARLADQDGGAPVARACCEHAPAGPELAAMAETVRLMEAGTLDGHAVVRALYPLDGPALVRVLRWLLARFPADKD